jgi:murein endopeptidase
VSRRIAGVVALEASEGEIAWSCSVAAVALPIRSAKWQDLIKEKDELPCKPKILWCTAAPSRWS